MMEFVFKYVCMYGCVYMRMDACEGWKKVYWIPWSWTYRQLELELPNMGAGK